MSEPARPAPSDPSAPPALRAAIDIGATAIRMTVAEVMPEHQIRVLEHLEHAHNLGSDVFQGGRIQQATIEESVDILRGFGRVLGEYGVDIRQGVRAVATSSVREALNRDTFVDRVYVATGIQIEVIEEAEVSRLNYAALRDVLRRHPFLTRQKVVAAEVGGGSTELLFLDQGQVIFAETHRLGSLRMREALESYHVPAQQVRAVLEQVVERSLTTVRQHLPYPRAAILLALADDVRLAARQIGTAGARSDPPRLAIADFVAFARKVVDQPPDRLVKKFGITYREAENLGPALLAYEKLAVLLKVKEIVAPALSLNDGLLLELAQGGEWSGEFRQQVTQSALTLGEKYAYDARHGQFVADLSAAIFRALRGEHRLDDRHELYLTVAGLLHEIGLFVSRNSHHKHSMYLIQNSELFGLSLRQTGLIAITARYHRKAHPDLHHEEYRALDREDRLTVAKLAAILRVADALDRHHAQSLRNLSFALEQGQFVIYVPKVDDLSLERRALEEKGGLFEELYGRKVVLRKGSPERTP